MPYYDAHTHKLCLDSPARISLYSSRVVGGVEVVDCGYFSAGIHPYDVGLDSGALRELFLAMVTHGRCVAVGECGVDKRVGSIEQQVELFDYQCAVAERLQKPLIIHCVKSLGEVLSATKDLTVPLIFHSYHRFDENLSRRANVYLSLSARDIAYSASVPLSRVLFETDEGEVPIEQIYSNFAEFRGVPLEELKEIVEYNFSRIFKLTKI